jgi:hypothetical protein
MPKLRFNKFTTETEIRYFGKPIADTGTEILVKNSAKITENYFIDDDDLPETSLNLVSLLDSFDTTVL